MGTGANKAKSGWLRCSTATFVLIAGAVPAQAAVKSPGPRGASLESEASLADQKPQPPPSPTPQERPEQAIIITGSRIPRTNLTAVSPVTVITDLEVKLEGALGSEDLLNQLPQVAPSQVVFQSNGATGTATVDLRNLGSARTLVLVNGRRLGPGDPSLDPDLNMVPTTLISRVEILTGGASSVYGSDAVSGVVNFILDTKLEGLRADGQISAFQHDNRNRSGLRDALIASGYGFPTGSVVDGGRQDANASFGRGYFDGRLHVAVYGGYRHYQALLQDRRDYSACSAAVDNEADNTVLQCGGSPASFPGNFFTFFDVFQITADRTFVPGISFFNFGPWNYFQRPDRRYTGGGFADANIGDALKPYVEVMYLDDRSVAQIAPSGDFGNTRFINCDNPLLSDQQRSLVCFDGNFVGQVPVFDDDGKLVAVNGSPITFFDPVTGAPYRRGRLVIQRRGVDSGPRQEDLQHKTLRLVGGIKGDVGRGILYDASYVRVRSKLNAAHLNDYSVTRMRRALDVVTDPTTGQPVCRSVLTGQDPKCVPWDIFAFGGVTPEAAAYLNVPAFRTSALTEQVGNASATIDLGKWGLRSPWAEENPQINAGAEYRKDTLDYEPDEAAQSGDLAGSPEDFPVHGSVEVKELFAETRIPLLTNRLIESLVVETGYRQSWYSNRETGFTTNAYKLALDLTAVRGLRFRASHHRAVRAPNINELFFPPLQDGFNRDRCAGVTPPATQEQCAFTGVTASQYGHIAAIPTQQGAFNFYNAVIGGNAKLGPETAMTRTLGVVFEPRFLRGFNATVDWWSIDLKGAIGQIGSQDIIDNCLGTGDPFFCGRIHRDAEGSLWLSPEGFIDDRLANLGSFKVKGVDIGANYKRLLGRLGSVTISMLGTYQHKFTIDLGGLSTPFKCAGRFGFGCFTPVPRWRHKARLTWDTPSGISVSGSWRYTSRMSLSPLPDLPNPPGRLSRRLPAQSFFDLSALVRVQRNYVLRMGVNNLLDREPPLLPFGEGALAGFSNGNTYPQWYDPLGRLLFIGATLNFK